MPEALEDREHGNPMDLLIRNGTVVDGSGAPARKADVAVQGGLIRAIEPPGRLGPRSSPRAAAVSCIAARNASEFQSSGWAKWANCEPLVCFRRVFFW